MKDQVSRKDFFTGCALVGLLSFLGNRGLGLQDEAVVEHAVHLANLLVDELHLAEIFELNQDSPSQEND